MSRAGRPSGQAVLTLAGHGSPAVGGISFDCGVVLALALLAWSMVRHSC